MLCYSKGSDIIFIHVDADPSVQQNEMPRVCSIYICNFLMLAISSAALYFDIRSIFAIMMQ